MKITRLKIENFKGVKNVEYFFKDRNFVYGRNGTGKTTIADAIMWLFTDASFDGKVKPNIRNVVTPEIIPMVEVDIDIDNNDYTFTKSQELVEVDRGDYSTFKKDNYYKVNGVSVNFATFKKHLSELDIDMSIFAMLVNPKIFVSKSKADMRNVVMKLAKGFTDIDIALKVGEATDVAEELKNLSLEEIEKSAKQTITNINRQYGKNGELIDAKIEALQENMPDIPPKEELEAEKKILQAELDKMQQESNGKIVSQANINAIKKILEELKQKYIARLKNIFSSVNGVYNSKIEQLRTYQSSLNAYNNNMSKLERSLGYNDEKIKTLKDELLELKSADTSVSDICPTCQQKMPKEYIEKAKANIEKELAEKIESKTKYIDALYDSSNEDRENYKTSKEKVEELQEKVETLKAEIEETPHFNKIDDINYKDYPELTSIVEEIEDKKAQVEAYQKSADSDIDDFSERYMDLENRIKVCDMNLSLIKNRELTLNRVEEYEQEKKKVVVARLQAEKLLYQIDLISKAKNEILADEINTNFTKVKWKLFDYCQNGEYKEVCEPLIDGKPFNDCLNTAAQVEAGIDIVNGLQNYYGVNYPIIIDNAECIDDKTKSRIESNSQIIWLSVSNLDEEIRLEVE